MQEQITLTLTTDLVQKLRSKAAAEGYANESEYVQEHLSETVGEDDHLEEWLQTVGVERYDAYDANPQEVFTADEVMAHVRNRLTQVKAG